MSAKKSNIILGLDPGTNVMGFGLIEVQDKKTKILQYGVFNFKKLTSHYDKLQEIYKSVGSVIEDYKPTEVAIEAPFFGKNVQSMLKLGRAQGVAIASAIQHGLPVFEYAPKKIKSAVTGNGNADKERVAIMVESFAGTKLNYTHFDATDALATAYCHLFQGQQQTPGKSYKSWEKFADKNKDRIK